MVVLGEQGGAVLGVAWPLPSGSASGSMEDIKRTLPALAATPLRPVQLKGRGYTTCTSLMTLMWFRCHIPHLTPTQFNGTLSTILYGDAIGTKVSGRYRQGGRPSGVAVKRGSTVIIIIFLQTSTVAINN